MEILHGFDGVYLPRIQVMVRRHGLSFARSFLTQGELDLLPPMPWSQIQKAKSKLQEAKSQLQEAKSQLPKSESQLQEAVSVEGSDAPSQDLPSLDARTMDARSLNRLYELLGGRFAAKEACLKALGTGFGQASMGLRSLEIRTNALGQPVCFFLGKVADRAKDLGIFSHCLSLSHEGDYAFASFVALAEGAGPKEPGILAESPEAGLAKVENELKEPGAGPTSPASQTEKQEAKFL